MSAAFYYVAGKYKADCVLSGSGTCSVSMCGQGYWSVVNINTPAMYGGNCNTSVSIPCYGAALTCGVNACDLGSYDIVSWANYKGNKNARWVYSTPTALTNADLYKWSFFNASISACNVSYAVTIEAIADDGINGISWNGSVMNPAGSTTDMYTVRYSNVSFVPGYNVLEVVAQNKSGAGGVIFDVVGSLNTPILLSGPSTTMIKRS